MQSGSWNQTTKILELVFNQPLQPGVLDPSNYTLQLSGPYGYYVVSSALASNNLVTCNTVYSAPLPTGPSRVSYAATPQDIVGVTGSPAAAFTNRSISIT